jgi:hypothetical protein
MKFLETKESIKDSRQFEPEIVIQKMKKIKKTKKNKLLNYKNIETLTNIYDESSTVEKESSTKPVIREGLSSDGIAHFNDDDYVGGKDNIYEGKGGVSETPSQRLEDLINYCYNVLCEIPLLTAYYIIRGIEQASNGINKAINSKKKATHNNPSEFANDQKIIANLIAWLFSILLSMYAIWNWFYIIAYKNENKEETILPTVLDRKLVYNKGVFDPLFKLIDYFFNLSLFYPEKLQDGIHLGSSYVRSTFNPSFIFAFVFFTIIFLFYHSLSFIRKFFISVVNFDMNNTLLSTMYGILCLLLVISFFSPPISINASSIEEAAALPANIAVQVAELFSNINPFKAILNLIIFIFHMLFIVFLGVPVAAFLCIGYLFTYTFFGVILLKWFDFREIWKLIWEKMPNYARSEKNKIKIETYCDPLTFWQTVVNAFHYSFDIIYKYSFELAFIYMMLFAFFDCWYKLKMRNVRLTMTVIVVVLLIGLLSGCYFHFKYEQESDLREALKKEKEVFESTKHIDTVLENTSNQATGIGSIFNSIASLFSSKIPSKIDEIPGMPKIPEIPGMPKIDEIPGMPKIDEIPGMPKIPSKIDEIPGMPKIPEMPKIPKM